MAAVVVAAVMEEEGALLTEWMVVVMVVTDMEVQQLRAALPAQAVGLIVQPLHPRLIHIRVRQAPIPDMAGAAGAAATMAAAEEEEIRFRMIMRAAAGADLLF